MDSRRRNTEYATQQQHRTAVSRFAPLLGEKPVDAVTWQDVDALVSALVEKTLKPATIKKTILVLAMVLDYAEINPNPARSKNVHRPTIKREPINPPTAAHLHAVLRVLPVRYRLPLLIYDDTGMRLGELEALTWGDVDVSGGCWRVTEESSKTGQARWVKVNPDIFDAVLALLPLEDRTADRRVFDGFNGDAFRTELRRSCTKAGVPLFKPHDLRHRRVSLLHERGMSWARIGEQVGQRNISVTADIYTHVLMDTTELDYPAVLAELAEPAVAA